MRTKAVMIAAEGSGRGKTTLVSALLYLLKRKKRNVHAFKCGPDYIDPMFHTEVLGVPSVNLDPFFMDEAMLGDIYSRYCGEYNVIEGCMGLYDGIGVSSRASSYETAKALSCPIVLCLDAHGVGYGLIPLIKGLVSEDEAGLVKAVFLNRVSAARYDRIKPVIEEKCGIKVIGYLPHIDGAHLKSRHLGLVFPRENEALEKTQTVAEVLSETIDFDAFDGVFGDINPVNHAEEMNSDAAPCVRNNKDMLKLLVARDEAFSFYYRDNLELLRELGAEMIHFSPLGDTALPAGCSGIIFGGGYPELYAETLAGNTSMLQSIRKAADDGMPMLAECGGFMYLSDCIETKDGRRHKMAGIFPGRCSHAGKAVRFGYVTAHGTDGEYSVKGHEFHHYDSECPGEYFKLERASDGSSYRALVRYKDVIAGYPHFYYRSDVGFIRDFIERMRKFAYGR